LSLKREFVAALDLLNRTRPDSVFNNNNKYAYKTWAFYVQHMDDSARYYAALWPERWFYRYGFLCDETQFNKFSQFSLSRVEILERMKFNMKIDKFIYHATCGDYKRADDLLKEMNRNFPHFGYYNWLNYPAYDRIKREYPAINETIKNLKIPPPAWNDKMLRELKSLL
jgi:tetratricopeptide (TPR) repeat protein